MTQRLEIKREWKDWEAMAHKIVKKYYPTIHRLDNMWGYKDLIGVATESFSKSILAEKNGRISCKFSTYLYKSIENDLLIVIEKEKTEKAIPQYYIGSIEGWEPVYDNTKFHFLSEEAKEVYRLLKETPKELAEMAKSLGLKEAITRYIKIHKGWKPRKLKPFWVEIKKLTDLEEIP